MSTSGLRIHEPLDHTNRPRCTECEREMWLMSIRIADLGLELRTYECARCSSSQTLLCQPKPVEITMVESPSIDPAKASAV
jgi:hypothetical protein